MSSEYLCADKSSYIYQLVHSGEAFFLSRPRRFGKSLFVSTLAVYFEGNKALFSGLAIEQLEKEWTMRPVFQISFARSKNTTKESLIDMLLFVELQKQN